MVYSRAMDETVPLHPLTQLQLFSKVKNVISPLMNVGAITADRAEDIFRFTKEGIVLCATPQDIRRLYEQLGGRYPELRQLQSRLDAQEQESLDRIGGLVVDQLFAVRDVSDAMGVLERMSTQAEEDVPGLVRFLEQTYPQEFAKALSLLRTLG